MSAANGNRDDHWRSGTQKYTQTTQDTPVRLDYLDNTPYIKYSLRFLIIGKCGPK